MGQVKNRNIISGGIAHLVFRNLNGRQVVQSKPGRSRQTNATKASGSEFRQCSSWARQLRTGLSPFLVGLTDSYMYRRLTGQFYTSLLRNTHLPKGQRTPLTADMKGLEGFEFNSHSPFSSYFTPVIETVLDQQRQLQITVPAFDPKKQLLFPQRLDKAELVVLVHATNFEDGTAPVQSFFTLPIEREVPLHDPTVWTSPPLPEGYLVLVVAKVLYYSLNRFTGRNYWNSREMNPAGVVFCG